MPLFNVSVSITENRVIQVEADSEGEAVYFVEETIEDQLVDDQSPLGGVLHDIAANYITASPVDPFSGSDELSFEEPEDLEDDGN